MLTLNAETKLNLLLKVRGNAQETIQRYITDWGNLTPTNQEAIYNRWLFAFLSVHTSWRSNVFAYQLLTENKQRWINDRDQLQEYLVESKVGLYAMRGLGISEFTKSFYENPEVYIKRDNETWVEYRNRLEDRTFGLGPAKTAFAIEMVYPLINQSVCLDTHMLQLYGYGVDEKSRAAGKKNYQKMEEHWAETAMSHGVSPFIARCIYWDYIQEKEDSMYWAHVFQKEPDLITV